MYNKVYDIDKIYYNIHDKIYFHNIKSSRTRIVFNRKYLAEWRGGIMSMLSVESNIPLLRSRTGLPPGSSKHSQDVSELSPVFCLCSSSGVLGGPG